MVVYMSCTLGTKGEVDVLITLLTQVLDCACMSLLLSYRGIWHRPRGYCFLLDNVESPSQARLHASPSCMDYGVRIWTHPAQKHRA